MAIVDVVTNGQLHWQIACICMISMAVHMHLDAHAIRAVRQSAQQGSSMHTEHLPVLQLFGTASMAASKVDDVTRSSG